MTEKIKQLIVRYRKLIRYVIVGGFTTVIGWGVFYLLDCLFPSADGGLLFEVWNAVSWMAAVLFAYFASRKFVFDSTADTTRRKWTEFSGFVLSRVFSLLLESGLMLILKCAGVSERVSKIPVSILVVICNYITGRLVFRHKKENNK